MAASIAARDLALDSGSRRAPPARRPRARAAAAQAPRAVGVEHDQRDVVGAPVADRDGLSDQRARGLDLGLDVRRRHVLAGGVDDQLLLAVDDPHVAVVVDRRRCRRCAASRRGRSSRRSARGRRGSRASRSARGTSSSPSSASAQLDPGQRPARPCRSRVARAGCRCAMQVSSDMPHSSQIGRPSAWKNSSTSTRRSAPRRRRASSPASSPRRSRSLLQHQLVGLRVLGVSSAESCSPACSARTRRSPSRSPTARRPARRVGLGRDRRLESGLHLLPDARDRAPDRRRTCGSTAAIWRGSATTVTWQP